MRLILATLLIAASLLSTPALAQHRGGHYGHSHHHYQHWGPSGWVAPFIVGGIVTYALTRPDPVYIQQPGYVQPKTIYIHTEPTNAIQRCTAWREIQDENGRITRERTCY